METRVIDGVRYVLVRADHGVEVNGIDVSIRRDENADDVEADDALLL